MALSATDIQLKNKLLGWNSQCHGNKSKKSWSKFLKSMASKKVDAINLRTAIGTVNYYDNQRSIGTSSEKAHASRMGAYVFDPINHKPETFLRHLRLKDHYIKEDGTHTGMHAVGFLFLMLGEMFQRRKGVIPELQYLKSSAPVGTSLEWQRVSRSRRHRPQPSPEIFTHNKLCVTKLYDKTSAGYNILHHV